MPEKLLYTELQQKISELQEAISSQRDAAKVLKKSEDSYTYLVQNAKDIICKINIKGYFVFFNPAAVRTTGFSEAELYDKHYLKIIRSDCREGANQLYVAQYEKEIDSTYHEFPIIKKDGQEMWIGQNVQLMREGEETDYVFPTLSEYREKADRNYLKILLERADADRENACRLSGTSRSRWYGLTKKYGLARFG